MPTYHVGICDDDTEFCKELKQCITNIFSTYGYHTETYIWNDGACACSDIPKIPDLQILFLDIELPERLGTDVGSYIRNTLNNSTMQIIFVSAKTTYALELFKLHPFDFLVKPLDYSYCVKMIGALIGETESNSRCYCFSVHRSINSVPFHEIEYIESRNKHLLLHKRDGSTVEFVGKLRDEGIKFPDSFTQIAKSYLVNMRLITAIKSHSVLMNSGTELSISRGFRDASMSAFHRYIGRL